MKLKSNEPFWLIKNGLMYSYPSLQANINTDILIVGSGITGSLIAHQCINAGHKVVLVDRRELVNGSSSATTSMLQYEIDVPLYKLIELVGEKQAVTCYQACATSITELDTIAKSIKSKAGFKNKKSLYFASSAKDLSWLKKEFEARKKAGFFVKWLKPETISNRYGIDNTHGGIISNLGASVDAFFLAHELIHFNCEKGLQVFDKTNITKVDYSSRSIKAETDKGYQIKAKKIIYCNGFESTEIIKESFVKLLSTYAIVSEQIPKSDIQKINKLLVWNTSDPYLYLRTTNDNRVLIGGEDEEFLDPEKRDKLIHKKSKKLEQEITKILPNIPFITDFSWAGTFGSTKDGLPYIGEHPDFPSSYFVLGFGGNGITFSVIGMQMVNSFLNRKKHHLSPYFKFGR